MRSGGSWRAKSSPTTVRIETRATYTFEFYEQVMATDWQSMAKLVDFVEHDPHMLRVYGVSRWHRQSHITEITETNTP